MRPVGTPTVSFNLMDPQLLIKLQPSTKSIKESLGYKTWRSTAKPSSPFFSQHGVVSDWRFIATVFNLCLKVFRDSASIFFLWRPFYSPICLTIRNRFFLVSLFLTSPFWCVKILLILIYCFTIFFSGDGFYFLFDPHNRIINAHLISLPYIMSPQNVAPLVSQFTNRDWHLLMCRWVYVFSAVVALLAHPRQLSVLFSTWWRACR